jgi:hypothetical protein
MLYEYYKAIKTLIEDAAGSTRFQGQPSRVNNRLNSVDWFNNQYEGIILNDRVAFVEFPQPLLPTAISKDAERAQLVIRIHLLTRALQKTDSSIPDQEIVNHETLAQSVLTALRGSQLSDESGQLLTGKLQWTSWQHWHKYEGWMVTWIELTCKTAVL